MRRPPSGRIIGHPRNGPIGVHPVLGSSDFDARITVEVDAAARTLVIEDNGAGLTDDEIDRYLATVGSGYTRRLREAGVGGSASELIGYFGLGFLSAFVIAERVEVWTASYQDPARAWRFASRSGQSYTVEPAEARPIGSRVTLFLSPKHATFADARAIRGLLRRYYRSFCDRHREDPGGHAILQETVGAPDMRAWQREWERFVLGLRFA